MKLSAKIVIGLLCFSLVIGPGLLWCFSPIFNSFPKPTGLFDVGIVTANFVDETRPEVHSKDPHAKREIVVDFYYPTIKSGTSKKYPYQPQHLEATKKVKATYTKIPAFVWNNLLSGIQSYAAPHAPIALDKPFPVIIFSHGIGSDVYYNVYLEELASHGYIIAAVYHPYDSEVVVFPDGKIVEMDPSFRSMIKQGDRQKIYEYRAQAHKIWLEDLKFLITKLFALNEDQHSLFYHRFDLQNIGAIGHSHGGGVVIDLVKTDDRVKAGIDLDGWTKSANTTQGFNKPFMFLLQEHGIDPSVEELYKNMGKDAYTIKIKGAGHGAFSDFILLKWPLVTFFDVAHINPNTVRHIISKLIQAFFDQYLKGDKKALEHIAQIYKINLK
jgi:dienelactone hydrolase